MLPLYALPVREMDFGASVFNDGQRRPNQMHRVLLVETRGDKFGEIGVDKIGHNTSDELCIRPYGHAR